MKVIDLLNKIANGEEVPKKIRINKIVYEYAGIDYKSKDGIYLFDTYILITEDYMNMEIEIIEDTPKEDKKIENLKLHVPYLGYTDKRFEDIEDKINEIIDMVNGDSDE